MSARGKSSKKGFNSKIRTDAIAPDTSDFIDIITDFSATDPYTNVPDPGITIVPPTTPPTISNSLLPPTNISAGPSQIFTLVSVNGNGSTATYTTQQNHGYSVGDIIISSGFTNISFNGTFTVTAITAKTFSVASTGSGTDVNGSVYNNNNYVGNIFYAGDGTPYIDVVVSFDEVLTAVEYRIEVTQIA